MVELGKQPPGHKTLFLEATDDDSVAIFNSDATRSTALINRERRIKSCLRTTSMYEENNLFENYH